MLQHFHTSKITVNVIELKYMFSCADLGLKYKSEKNVTVADLMSQQLESHQNLIDKVEHERGFNQSSFGSSAKGK